jgi:hypothetical protein
LWTARPRRKKPEKVWRFFVDIGRFKENGRFQIRKCRITGRRKGDGEFDRDTDDGVDGDGSDGEDESGNESRDGVDDDNGGDDDGGGGHPDGGHGGGRGGQRPRDNDNDENEEQQGHTRPRLGGQFIKRQHSSPATSSQGRPIKRSRSSSPVLNGFEGFDGFRRPQGDSLVKSERSASPEVEIISSRAITCCIDLTSDGDLIDLTQEDDPEE